MLTHFQSLLNRSRKSVFRLFRKLSILFNPNYDSYVPYETSPHSIYGYLGVDRIQWLKKLRINYWHIIASKYSSFSPFFSEALRSRVLTRTDLRIEVIDIYRQGYTVMSDILDERELSMIKLYVSTFNRPKKPDCNFIQLDIPEELSFLKVKLINRLFPLYTHFFNKKEDCDLTRINIQFRIDYSFDGVDSSPYTANWHADRFVPTLNAIYFPFGASWGQFERDVGNPVISEEDILYYSKPRASKYYIPLKSEERDNEYYPITGREKKKFSLDSNQLIVGTHHMQHRRSPIFDPGERIAVFIDHYNFFTRRDLRMH